MLYEMLTGRRVFDGAETTDVLARILEREPDFTALPPLTPEAIRRLLRRCLQKNAAHRLRDIAVARLEIDEARSDRLRSRRAFMSPSTLIYVRPFPGPGAPVTISTDGGVEPRWSRSGNDLFYRNGNRMMAVRIAGAPQLIASAPQVLFEGRFEFKESGGSSANYDIAPDGRFVTVRRKNPLTPTTINIVFNWPRALAVE